ncbi:MAG TPA: hypothetical protein VKT72_11645 [Candidatus Baltobacteraceae bacterium]|nr:hypothetical protein [Candidatus Baltobacteraceae bacterium]
MIVSLPRREADLDIEHTDSRIIVHDRKRDYVHVMDQRALAVLQECDGTHSCNQIARELSYRRQEPYDNVAREVAHLVAAFADLALVESALLKN